MIRYALALAALPALVGLAAPASAQSLCERPVADLTAAQLDACRADGVVVVRPIVEVHRSTGVTILRGQ